MKKMILIIVVSLFVFAACSKNKTEPKTAKIINNNENISDGNNQDSNILKINICELIPADLLAEKIGGKVLKQPQHSNYGTTQGCEYEIDPPGADNYEYCAVWFYPTSLFEGPESALETSTGLNQKATVEHLTGFGDQSYVIHNETEEQSIIHILIKNKVYIEIKAEKFDDAKKITELVLSKI
jgi:hypothetical protein